MTIHWGRLIGVAINLAIWAMLIILLPGWLIIGGILLLLGALVAIARYSTMEIPRDPAHPRAEDQASHPDQGPPVR